MISKIKKYISRKRTNDLLTKYCIDIVTLCNLMYLTYTTVRQLNL